MSYSNLYLQSQSRTPPLLIALALVVSLGVGGYFFLSDSTPTRASKKTVKRHEITNVSARQIGIFWESEAKDKGWLLYGDSPSNLKNIALDQEDTSETKTDKLYHYAVLKNLSPDTTYFYKIVSNNELIAGLNDEPFQVRTSINHNVTSALKPAYGKVILPNGSPAVGTQVLLYYKNAYPLLATVGQTGEWLIPLQFAIDKNDNSVIAFIEKEKVRIEMINPEGTSQIEALISRLDPVPQTVIIGENYSFMDETQVLPAFTQRTPVPGNFAVDIKFPRDGAVIPGNTPLIRGSGIPGKDVVVNVNSRPPLSAKVVVDAKGDWNVSIPVSILPGTYQLILTTEDNQGKKVGMKRTFTIAKSGETVLGDATGSATLTPSKSPTPTRILTVSPTSTASASISATLIPTSTPYEVYQPPTTDTNPPVSGTSILPYIMMGAGLVIVGAGLVLLF